MRRCADGGARVAQAPDAEIGVIGGSGFYELEELTGAERLQLSTPFGEPSSPITVGTLHGRRVAFISRHDEGHRLLPGELPSHANIYALKLLGVRRVLAVSAVGSLQQSYAPLHAAVPDQLIDRTRGRRSTFFGDGLVAHVAFADPFCPALSQTLATAGEEAGFAVHRGGTLVTIEGPAFSTRAESQLYRSWGAALIGMTALPEAKLAREAELCYAQLALVTDYDVWHEAEADVSADVVIGRLLENASRAREAVSHAARLLPAELDCGCGEALGVALVTAPERVPAATRRRLAALLEPHWGPAP